jgi:glycosyltransferase involved in cell wall biosynthesis
MKSRNIYFYPYLYLRDRQLDTIRRWPSDQVVNPEAAQNRSGSQVSSSYANASKLKVSWKQKLPLLNIKLRPRSAPKESVVYVWGAVVATGRFIVDLDNPWSLVGYNLRAMPIYRFFIKKILLSARCVEIRCMSEACRLSLKALFGYEIYNKATVHYPCIPQVVTEIPTRLKDDCRFLFVGTQFEIKGGVALLKAFRRVYEQSNNARLDIITHLPAEYAHLAMGCPGIHIHEARYSRNEIHEQFMRQADVLVLPTYVESFGMVALEALAHGLALIATDVYALRELVDDGRNGRLLSPPLSIWDDYLPSALYLDIQNVKRYIRSANTADFENRLVQSIEQFSCDSDWRLRARQASVRMMAERFAC